MCPNSDSMDSVDPTNSSDHQSDITTPTVQTSPLDLSINRPDFTAVSRTISNDTEPPSPMDASTTTFNHNTEQTSVDTPVILIQPKSEWHYRSMKDLAKKHIPLIAGEGPQRTPLKVKVPPKSHLKMYLGVQVVTVNEKYHDSKVIVPNKTRAAKENISHNNDLHCLNFTECQSTDSFDLENRIVYLEITDREYDNQSKDVRVHMFNLYQNHNITKGIIEVKQLHKCKLAFWFCIRDNNRYEPISKCAYSSTIQEKKNNIRSDVLQSATDQPNGYIPSQVKYEAYDYNESATDGDDYSDDFNSSQSNFS